MAHTCAVPPSNPRLPGGNVAGDPSPAGKEMMVSSPSPHLHTGRMLLVGPGDRYAAPATSWERKPGRTFVTSERGRRQERETVSPNNEAYDALSTLVLFHIQKNMDFKVHIQI